MQLIGFTLDLFGKILISYTVIAVHHRFRKEHKVDEEVFEIMRKEQNFIDGQWCDADSGQTMNNVNPANGETM